MVVEIKALRNVGRGPSGSDGVAGGWELSCEVPKCLSCSCLSMQPTGTEEVATVVASVVAANTNVGWWAVFGVSGVDVEEKSRCDRR